MKSGGRIVILGAGFSGMITAIYAAKKSPKTEILLIDRNDFHVYTPWLYEAVTGGLDDKRKKTKEEFAHSGGISIRKIVSRWENLHFRKAEIIGCDFKNKQIQLAGGRAIHYGKVVLAFGSRPAFFGIKGLKEHALLLRGKEGGVKLREKLQVALKNKNARIVVAGAGAAGVELVAELANYVKKQRIITEISLIEAGEHVLNRFPKHIQRYSEQRLKYLDVELLLNSPVSKVSAKQISIRKENVIHTVSYDVFIWTGGIQPADILEEFDLPKDTRGRIRVLSNLQVEGHPDVYAAGDAISFEDTKRDKIAPPAAWAAIMEGKVLGHNLVKKRQRNLRLPKRYPAVINVGGRKAVGVVSFIPIFGFLAFLVRRAVDLNYWRKLLPFTQAVHLWWTRVWLFGKND